MVQDAAMGKKWRTHVERVTAQRSEGGWFHHGSPWWVLLAAAVALGAGLGLNTAPTPLPLFVIVGLAVGGLGVIARAAAHKNDEFNWLDHLGKLLAVSAFIFAFTGAALQLADDWVPIGHGVIWIGLLLLGFALIVWSLDLAAVSFTIRYGQGARTGGPEIDQSRDDGVAGV